MTRGDLEKRMAKLERAVEQLQARVYPSPGQQIHWWRDEAGRFANDPLFDEMVRLTQTYRKSLGLKSPKKPVKKKHART